MIKLPRGHIQPVQPPRQGAHPHRSVDIFPDSVYPVICQARRIRIAMPVMHEVPAIVTIQTALVRTNPKPAFMIHSEGDHDIIGKRSRISSIMLNPAEPAVL